ncbi:MAG: beta-galactosidase [Armatimonadota bacterium]
MRYLLLFILSLTLTTNALALHKPAPVDEYAIHPDGGLIYNPLSREAASTGQLAKYSKAVVSHGSMNLDGYHLEYSVPKKVAAYDVVPINYKLTWTYEKPDFPIAVEATAFEDDARRAGRNLYDLALPGKLDLQVTYLGSISADVDPSKRNLMKPDLSDKEGTYPPFTRKPMVRSGVVESADLVWFQFRVKNTGNTILDSEGFGGYSFKPELLMIDESGNEKLVGIPYNRYIRDLGYLYPGESRDIWVQFRGADGMQQVYGLNPGSYHIRLTALYRWYKYFDDMVNMWEGYRMFVCEQSIAVGEKAVNTLVPEMKVILTDGNEADKITRWIHTFEEFMTAFDCHISQPEGAKSVEGTLYLQVAPWTKNVVLKLINTGKGSIKTAAISVQVETGSLKVRFDADHPMCKVVNGLKEPVIFSLSMADMRTNVQLGPFPEKHILDRLKEMRECGINVISTTCMPWLYNDMKLWAGYGDAGVNPNMHNGDAVKYALDLSRQMGLAVEGIGSYPFNRYNVREISNWITGGNIAIESASVANREWNAAHADPNLPTATASMWLYQFHRWGDTYFQDSRGNVPITCEDTRGLLRQDINGRMYTGASTLAAFREWVERKYRSIEAANTAWGSAYKSFAEIDPEENQTPSPYESWPFLQYNKPGNVFCDWSAAMEDFDIFRTELRLKSYDETLKLVRKEIPQAVISMRTEGSNVVVAGIDPQSRNPHFRHIYYSQRRGAVIGEVIAKSDAVKYHADFPTLPFTPTELRKLVKMGVEQGIVPVYMPQFDNMRDMAVNARYGSDISMHYNLPEPKKSVMMHVLTAVYPWFMATYEEGGTPGILWEDYECDGFATETQKREMRFFKQKLDAALNTPAALRARKVTKPNSEAWRKKATPKWSYVLPKPAGK